MVLLIFVFDASVSHLGSCFPLVQYDFLRQADPIRLFPEHANALN